MQKRRASISIFVRLLHSSKRLAKKWKFGRFPEGRKSSVHYSQDWGAQQLDNKFIKMLKGSMHFLI